MRLLRQLTYLARFIRFPGLRASALLAFALAESVSHAYVVGITPGVKSIYLQVGAGSLAANPRYNAGGIPGSNATINRVSVTVPAASLGSGSVAMTTDSTVTQSGYDGFSFCVVPAQVYISGFFRTPGASAVAKLTVSSPAALVNAGGDTIPFNQVSWIAGGAGESVGTTIASGTFVGGTVQPLLDVAFNNWFESCLKFSYANSQLVAPGVFTGRVSYTLTAP